MKALEDKICAEGEVLPGNILKVGSFLNHQVDVDFVMEMGREIAKLFADGGVTKILTIETSGIAVAMAAAAALHVPMVFAKKHRTGNLSGEFYTAVVHSYTHGTDYHVVVSRDYLCPQDRVLLVDDFLANGRALEGLMEIAAQAGAEVVAPPAPIEKGFQHGGDRCARRACAWSRSPSSESMDENGLTFR